MMEKVEPPEFEHRRTERRRNLCLAPVMSLRYKFHCHEIRQITGTV
jgi:hypothetical protein